MSNALLICFKLDCNFIRDTNCSNWVLKSLLSPIKESILIYVEFFQWLLTEMQSSGQLEWAIGLRDPGFQTEKYKNQNCLFLELISLPTKLLPTFH